MIDVASNTNLSALPRLPSPPETEVWAGQTLKLDIPLESPAAVRGALPPHAR